MLSKETTPAYDIKAEYTYPEINNPVIAAYINDRLLAQIKYYDDKSCQHQARYKRLSIVSMCLSACIPIFTLVISFNLLNSFPQLIIAILSSAVTVISGTLALNGYKELWIQYRTNCEILKSVLHRFYTQTGEFASQNQQENFKTLVGSCEQYLIKEFGEWQSLNVQDNQPSTNS